MIHESIFKELYNADRNSNTTNLRGGEGVAFRCFLGCRSTSSSPNPASWRSYVVSRPGCSCRAICAILAYLSLNIESCSTKQSKGVKGRDSGRFHGSSALTSVAAFLVSCNVLWISFAPQPLLTLSHFPRAN